MPQATFVSHGTAIDYTPGSDLASGAVVVQGDLVGVTVRPITADTLGSLTIEGVLDFAKATGVASGIAVGVDVYWDVAEEVAKTDAEAGANKRIGKTVAAAGDDDTTVRVRLTP